MRSGDQKKFEKIKKDTMCNKENNNDQGLVNYMNECYFTLQSSGGLS